MMHDHGAVVDAVAADITSGALGDFPSRTPGPLTQLCQPRADGQFAALPPTAQVE